MADHLAIMSAILSNDVLQKVFKTILENRSVYYKDIVGAVVETPGVSSVPEVRDAVDALMKADLVQEKATAIKDFNTYYITSDGLTAGKKLSTSLF